MPDYGMLEALPDGAKRRKKLPFRAIDIRKRVVGITILSER
jgi:hypothetical protein